MSLMQLLACGSQDIYLKGNNFIFKLYYKNHNIIEIVNILYITGLEFNNNIKFIKCDYEIKDMFFRSYINLNCSKLKN